MADNIIELKGVNKWFGDFQVLKNVDLNVGLKETFTWFVDNYDTCRK